MLHGVQQVASEHCLGLLQDHLTRQTVCRRWQVCARQLPAGSCHSHAGRVVAASPQTAGRGPVLHPAGRQSTEKGACAGLQCLRSIRCAESNMCTLQAQLATACASLQQ